MSRKKIGPKKSQERDVALDPTQDEFYKRSATLMDWLVAHRKPVGLLFALVVVVWAGLAAWLGYSESHRDEQADKLAEALIAAYAPIFKQDADSGAAPDALRFASYQARLDGVVERLKEVEAPKGSELYAVLSLTKAQALFDAGKYDEAAAAFAEAGALAPVRVNAVLGQAAALESAGKVDQAAALYKQVAERKGRVGLWGKLALARLEKDENKAADQLEAILKEITAASSPDRSDALLVAAREQLLALRPDAEVPDLPAGIDPVMLQQLLQLNAAQGGAGR